MSESPRTPAAPLLDNVLDELGRDIIAGVLPEGKTFTLQDLSNRFDISRTVAREAMRALEQLGLVSSSRRVGITVRPRSSWAAFDQAVIDWRLASPSERRSQLRSLSQLRSGVEPQAARLAAAHGTDEQREELVTLARRMRELGESGEGSSLEFLEADVRFHALLLEASGNEMFAALAPSMLSMLHGRTRYGLQPDEPAAVALSAHEQLARAIAEGDEEGAEQQSRALLTEASQIFISDF
ncbi:FadR family transcriptional regulator [Corynebacterium hylobatis]|uniref:FadR family transcriptional regulator n=1 Tax=Corynebacterium hylobatis TaxID=1859290 RepID=A0A430HYN8_9CORY|nr:FadR/GntR family transcriptional regulator [Corynebacterium hylobatis]RSZ63223.1 FadR family transcriptional regulator [Corynebacterium hylobatis]